jgi:hypothetical protein
MDYKAPQIETFEEAEVLGDAPEATGTHVPQGSIIHIHEA